MKLTLLVLCIIVVVCVLLLATGGWQVCAGTAVVVGVGLVALNTVMEWGNKY